jgi:hypothetical protein
VTQVAAELHGAAWVFTRSGGVWTQQGDKLVGAAAVGAAGQGLAVALSADGRTALVGGPRDDSGDGAAWVFVSASAYPNVVWVPVAAHNAGLHQSQWRTDLGLLNTGTTTANVQMRFYGPGGLDTDTTYVPAKAQSILVDVVGQLGASGQGALQIASDLPLKVTSRTYNQVASAASCYPNGTQGQDYPGVVASSGLATGQSAYLAGLSESAAYRTNIGLLNCGATAAVVLVTLYDGAGTELGSYTVDLASGEWAQATQPFKSDGGQMAMARGYAMITVQSGSGVFGFASVVDNVTSDPTTVTTQP